MAESDSSSGIRCDNEVNNHRNMDDPDAFSDYFNSLRGKKRLSYTNKLTLSNGMRFLTRTHCRVCGSRIQPKLQWPDIFLYLVEKPSVCMREKLQAYKSLDAYTFILCRHVQEIQYQDLSNYFCVLQCIIINKSKTYILMAGLVFTLFHLFNICSEGQCNPLVAACVFSRHPVVFRE